MKNHFYLGIDLDDQNAVISYYELNMKEPETLSMIAGSEVYQIPVLLTRNRQAGQWLIGDEAKRSAISRGKTGVTRLLSHAVNREQLVVEGESYPACELLYLYLKKLLLLAGSLGKDKKPDRVVICFEKLSENLVQLFREIAPKLGLGEGEITLLGRKECFYYFAYHQQRELMLHDVFLFDYRGEEVRCCRVSRQPNTKPQLITITDEMRTMRDIDRDQNFLRILQECYKGRIVSSSYLTGDGFDGGWMKRSVSFLCQGRRAFMGKNLYAKGACYAAAILDQAETWEYVYLGDNEMKVNVSLKLFNKGNMEFYTLLSAGDNWYEAIGTCEVILDGTPEISFWLQPPNRREAKIERLELSDLPKRPNRTTRLRITAKPLSDTKVQIQIKDLGFGEIFKSSEKVWEYVMVFEEDSKRQIGQ